jgi:hypothetical protein
MPAETLHFPPNVPITLSLVDPEGLWDSDLRQGSYRTTTGQTFTLPRAAVVLLNQLEPKPGEEIQITRHWKGTPRDPFEWTICLSPRSEQFRAAEETAQDDAETPSEIADRLERSIDRARRQKPVKTPPTLVKRPPQPERGTGTDGPVPDADAITRTALSLAAAANPVKTRPPVIPWNVAFREVSRFVAAELKTNDLQWSDASQQDLVSTVLIAEVKAGRIGPWERSE